MLNIFFYSAYVYVNTFALLRYNVWTFVWGFLFCTISHSCLFWVWCKMCVLNQIQ